MDKFGVWNAFHYGQLPFVLAYATGGYTLSPLHSTASEFDSAEIS